MMIGLTGTKSSGKGEVAKILEERGFAYSSTSDRVREEAVERGITDYKIRDLQNIGNDLRDKFGRGILAKRTLEKLNEKKDCVIDGIRNTGEIEELKKQKDFVLIAVDSPLEKRFEFIKQRGRKSDPKTWEGFIEMDKRDRGLNERGTGQQVAKCMELADFRIENNGTLENLKKKVNDILDHIIRRPSWDDYFLEIMKSVSKRATCNRGRSGCVIAKDKQILVTGYVGAPVGLPHCDEIGHQMKKVINEEGTISEHCVRTTHAEQNAICQAAKLGISIKDSVLYCSMTPCAVCAKMIINSGIKRVVVEKRYHRGKESEELFEKAGVKLKVLNDSIMKYFN